MLDQEETDTPSAEPAEPVAPVEVDGERRTKTITVVLSVIALAVALGIAYFPSVFKGVASYDDEGSFLLAIRQFMHHGSLYVHTHGSYGPFYFSFAGLIFRVIGQDPVLTNGRMIVLTFTAVSAAMFAAAVWRVSRSLPFALLCEVCTFIVLIRVAGTEPMHPGSMIVLVLSFLAYAAASYAMTQSTASLVALGVTIGFLAMMKINVGIFAAAAVGIAFVVGNSEWPRWFRVVVGTAGALVPFLVTEQLLYQTDTSILAAIVCVGLLATYATLSSDPVAIPRRSLWVIMAGTVGAIVLSVIWPLATGSAPGAMFHGVVIQPLGQADHLQLEHGVHFDQLSFVLTVFAVYAVLARRYVSDSRKWAASWQMNAAFGVASFMVLGLGIYGGFGAWLPAIALIPALAFLSDAPANIRTALRILVPVAILQMLHAYPVAGSQVAWSRVIVSVPALIAVAAAVHRVPTWEQVGARVRTVSVGAIAILIIAVAGFVPLTQWHNYNRRVALRLPGTHYVHVEPHFAVTLRKLVANVRHHCDTFYSAPALDSLYIYTQLPNPTGMLADTPGALNAREQREVVASLQQAHADGKRVCIVRDVERTSQWVASSYGKGPLGVALAHYTRRIFRADRYTVSINNTPLKS